MRRLVAGLAAVASLLAASGCEMGQDEELTPKPRRTVTISPSPSPPPPSVPVGQGKVSPDDVVWAQGNVLRVGGRAVDLSPVRVDAFVAVRGGVFVLSSGELWFTDLTRLRGTRLTEVTRLGATADRSRVVLSREGGDPSATYAYDTSTGGQVVDGATVQRASARELLGDVRGVAVTPRRFRGAVPKDFEPVGRAGPARVYGLAGGASAPTAVVSCDLTRRTCSRLGAVDPADPVVFGSGK